MKNILFRDTLFIVWVGEDMEEFEPKLKVKEKTFNRAFFSKYIYIFIIGLCLLLGVSYSLTFFIQNKTIATGRITTGDLTITFTDRNITALRLVPAANDKNGLSLYSKELTITNTTSVDGKVKLILTRTSGLNLTDMRYAIIVNGAIQDIADVPENGEVLSTVVMGGSPGETVNVELRLWPKAAYVGNESTFVGELVPEIRYFGTKASSLSSPAGKYVNFNCNGNNCEVWQIVKVENGRLVLTRQNDYSGATERVNSGRYVSGLSFNDNSLITSVSNDQDHKNVYLLRTVKISGGTGTQNDPYILTNDNSIISEPDKKAIAEITYETLAGTEIGKQRIYDNEINYISQEYGPAFVEWQDGNDTYTLGDIISFTTDKTLTGYREAAADEINMDNSLTGFNCDDLQCTLLALYQYRS